MRVITERPVATMAIEKRLYLLSEPVWSEETVGYAEALVEADQVSGDPRARSTKEYRGWVLVQRTENGAACPLYFKRDWLLLDSREDARLAVSVRWETGHPGRKARKNQPVEPKASQANTGRQSGKR